MGLPPNERDPLTERIIGAAIEVHRHLGPGLLESTYEQCLCWELAEAGLGFLRQPHIPIIYKGRSLADGYRPDLFVEGRVIVEAKAVERILAVHEAQLLTYLRITGMKVGLLVNFNTRLLVNGVKRFVF